MLLNNFDFDKTDLMNYKNKERYMNAKVMMADKATQTLNKEIKATQTDLPNDKATQTYNFDERLTLLLLTCRGGLACGCYCSCCSTYC